MVTSSEASPLSPSPTVRRNTYAPARPGTKEGPDPSGPVSDTVGPDTCNHEKVMGSPSGSEERLPSRRTVALRAAAWSAPAFASGSAFVALTSTVSRETPPFPSVTFTPKVYTPRIEGVNVGVALFAPAIVTAAGPETSHHSKLNGSSSGSDDRLASRVTRVFFGTV